MVKANINDRVGQIRTNKHGLQAKCIEYINAGKVKIQSVDNKESYYTSWDNFNNGRFGDFGISLRLNQTRVNDRGYSATCIEDNGCHNILIQYENGSTRRMTWNHFNKGKFLDPDIQRIGVRVQNKHGFWMECIDYKSFNETIIKFDIDNKIKTTTWHDFIRGWVLHPSQTKEERVGIKRINKKNEVGECIVYNNASDIIIRFEDGSTTHSQWTCFINGEFSNPNDCFKSNKYGGIFGNRYPSKIDKHQLPEYHAWMRILARSNNNNKKNSCYENVNISDFIYYDVFYEWIHSQDNFDKWLNDKTIRWHIDKDILSDKHNKIYSSNTCLIVPERVNYLFTHWSKESGLPSGVSYRKDTNKYYSFSIKNNKTSRTSHDTIEEAFSVYKQYKENRIKMVAKEEYDKGNITKRCYDAMMKYEVEITD